MLESYVEYASRARLLTQIHAKPKGAKKVPSVPRFLCRPVLYTLPMPFSPALVSARHSRLCHYSRNRAVMRPVVSLICNKASVHVAHTDLSLRLCRPRVMTRLARAPRNRQKDQKVLNHTNTSPMHHQHSVLRSLAPSKDASTCSHVTLRKGARA